MHLLVLQNVWAEARLGSPPLTCTTSQTLMGGRLTPRLHTHTHTHKQACSHIDMCACTCTHGRAHACTHAPTKMRAPARHALHQHDEAAHGPAQVRGQHGGILGHDACDVDARQHAPPPDHLGGQHLCACTCAGVAVRMQGLHARQATRGADLRPSLAELQAGRRAWTHTQPVQHMGRLACG